MARHIGEGEADPTCLPPQRSRFAPRYNGECCRPLPGASGGKWKAINESPVRLFRLVNNVPHPDQVSDAPLTGGQRDARAPPRIQDAGVSCHAGG